MASGPPEEKKRAWLAAARSSFARSLDQAPDPSAGSGEPRWGYLRIRGEFLKLGIDVSATTIATVLREGGLGPAPRRIGPTWTQFLRLQAYGILSPGAPSEEDSLEDLPSGPVAMSEDPAETDEPIRDDPSAPKSTDVHPRQRAFLRRASPCDGARARDGPAIAA
jgi:hypothetical protein